MGRARSPHTSDKKFQHDQQWYAANRDRILARAKADYAAHRIERLRAMKIGRDAVRAARLIEKRKLIYAERRLPEPITQLEQGREYVRRIKTENPCLDCLSFYPYYVMDFDHVRGTKLGDVSDLSSKWCNPAVLMAEIAKCDLVCSNCHRERTQQRTYQEKISKSRSPK